MKTAPRRNRRSFFRLYSFYFDHGPYDFRQRFRAGHFCLFCFSFLTFFVNTLYSSSLLSQLLTTNVALPFTTVQQLARVPLLLWAATQDASPLLVQRVAAKDVQLYGYAPEFAYWLNVNNSQAYLFSLMRNATTHNPPVFIPNDQTVLDLMSRKGHIVKPSTGIQTLHNNSTTATTKRLR